MQVCVKISGVSCSPRLRKNKQNVVTLSIFQFDPCFITVTHIEGDRKQTFQIEKLFHLICKLSYTTGS